MIMSHVKSFCILVLVVFATAAPAAGQEKPMSSAGRQKIALERLRTTARVLYVAAHPDDENTRLLAYLANARHLDVAYLSITRGGGGQNLIGPEQAELLAAIRTQELLAARRVDGARQFFTRARDFGYSKTPEETLSKWGRDAILSDVVWVIRKFRPDVIVTRFTETGPSHGHHTASAQLARAAFSAAGDPEQFKEHFAHGVTPWAPTRLVLNVPRWGRSDDDVSGYLALDVGGYDPRLGVSYGEVAAISRTNHKSQGFGSSGRRGPILEYFEGLAGPPPTRDILDGIPVGWQRFEQSDQVERGLAIARDAFTIEAPERMVPGLLAAREALVTLSADHPVPRVLERIDDIDDLIAGALGLYAEAQAARSEVAPGETIDVALEILLRRPGSVQLTQIGWPDGPRAANTVLSVHRPVTKERSVLAARTLQPSIPHWLHAKRQANTYSVPFPARVAEPEDPSPLHVDLELKINGLQWRRRVPITYRWTDQVHGERRRRVLIVPPLTVTPVSRVNLFPSGKTAEIALKVRAGRPGVRAKVDLGLPRVWKAEPQVHEISLSQVGDETTVRFLVTPPSANEAPIVVNPIVTVDRKAEALRLDVIDYPHLPVQAVLQPSSLRLVPLDFRAPRGRIGYIPGSGDAVAADLRLAGVNVETIDEAALSAGQFDGYSAILVGVRAYNTREDEMRAAHPALMKWVKGGGRLVAQYNTSHRWRTLTVPVGPFPFEINRGRVTDETAAIQVLAPEHAVFKRPHKIGPADFRGWVQERGLYFAEKWEDPYTPLLAIKDPGEELQQGSLLMAPYGKGSFVYTGLSFFRQLPAGVPGAYRLLANLLDNEATR